MTKMAAGDSPTVLSSRDTDVTCTFIRSSRLTSANPEAAGFGCVGGRRPSLAYRDFGPAVERRPCQSQSTRAGKQAGQPPIEARFSISKMG
jgi:hypothetical protein